MTKTGIWTILYALLCIGIMLFIFFTLAAYEDNFTGSQNDWYLSENMTLYQYAAYLLTFVVSFPLGTFLSLLDADYIGEKWYFVCIPNFILYFYFMKRFLLTKTTR